MKLYIKNFEVISEAEINLKGFTVLTGRSNSGKSSIRRAIELVLYNRWDMGFIKSGESHCIVKLTIDDNNYIQITKPENTYTVMVNGSKSVYPKVAKNMLEELYDLGLDYFYDSEGYSHNVHIRRQTDPWYYITSSNQEQSRVIASIFNFDEIKNILKKSYKDKTDVTSQAENLAKDIDNLKLEGQDLDSKLTLLLKLKDKLIKQKVLVDYINLKDNVKSVEQKVKTSGVKVNHIDELVVRLENFKLVTKYIELNSLFRETRGDLNATEIHKNTVIYKIELITSIKNRLVEQDYLYKYLKIVDGCILTAENLKSEKRISFNLSNKIKLLKSIVENIKYKNTLENYLVMHDKLLTKSVDYNFMVSKLKQITKVKNSLTRFSSLKRYLLNDKKADEISLAIYNLKLKKRAVVKLISKFENFKTVSGYLDIYSKSVALAEDKLKSDKNLKAIKVTIKEVQEIINESITCPHCEKPIGEFVKRCSE